MMRSVFLLLLAMASGAEAQVFRCEAAGRIVFSDQPCPQGAKATKTVHATAGAVGSLDMQIAVKHYSVEGRDYRTIARTASSHARA